MFFYLGVLPGGASERVIANLVGKRFKPAAQELLARNLAHWQDGRYTLLAPIRAYTVATRSPKRLAAVRLRAAKFYSEFVRLMNTLLSSFSREGKAEQITSWIGIPFGEKSIHALTLNQTA